MEDEKFYHILYADDVRLNSLAAQIYGKVTENLTEEEQREDVIESVTGVDVKLLQHNRVATVNKATKQSTYYTVRDALYFDILNELGINPSEPEEFSQSIVDGEIHVLSGSMKISGSSVISPVVEMMREVLPNIRKNPALVGMKFDNKMRQQLDSLKQVVEILPKIPMPTVLRLYTSNNAVISGPIEDTAARLNMGNMMLLFKGQLPFDWSVVGYLYPAQNCGESSVVHSDFLDIMGKSISEFGNLFIPHSDAIMFPLLILR